MDFSLQAEKFGPDAANGGIQHEVGVGRSVITTCTKTHRFPHFTTSFAFENDVSWRHER